MSFFKTTAVLVLVFANVILATPLFDDSVAVDESEDGEERLFFSANGGISFTNSTVDLASLLTAALLGLLIALTLGGGLFGGKGQQGYGYGHEQQNSGYSSNSHNFQARSDKIVGDNDLASQMYQLAMAFKKYEVKDTECQLFVACEASQVKQETNEAASVLAEIADGVKPIMRKLGKHGRQAVLAKDEYVVKLLDAFMYGEELQRKNKRDVCEAFREKCYNQNKKPVY